ncbi:hypothetical protein WG66_001264, partial [Moniliophthora roreri]
MKSSTQFATTNRLSNKHIILSSHPTHKLLLFYDSLEWKNCLETCVNPTLLPTTSTHLNLTCISRNSVPIITY